MFIIKAIALVIFLFVFWFYIKPAFDYMEKHAEEVDKYSDNWYKNHYGHVMF